MDFIPRPNVIIIQQVDPPKESAAGIVFPDNVSQPNADKLAKVVAVGENIKCAKVDDCVVFSRQFADMVQIGSEVFAFVTEKHILAIRETK